MGREQMQARADEHRLVDGVGDEDEGEALFLGQRQQVVNNPPWAAVAVRLIRSL